MEDKILQEMDYFFQELQICIEVGSDFDLKNEDCHTLDKYLDGLNSQVEEQQQEIERLKSGKHETVEEFCDYYKDLEDSTYYDSECGRKTIDVCDIRNWKYCPSCSREIVIRDHHGKPEELIR